MGKSGRMSLESREEEKLNCVGERNRGQMKERSQQTPHLIQLAANVYSCKGTGYEDNLFHEDNLFQKQLPGEWRLGDVQSTCAL